MTRSPREAKDSTKLIVAQRIGTIMNADRIIVLDDGKVVGQGTHEELLDNVRSVSADRRIPAQPVGAYGVGGVFLCFCQLLGELTCRDSGWLSWARFALPVASGVLSRVARFRLRGLVPGRGFRF